MKIVHTSDIHLDSPLTSRLSPEKARARRRELLDGFSRLVERAEQLGAEAMIIAGDLFDSERASKRAMDTALEVISKSPLSFFYLSGNHEGTLLCSDNRDLPKNLYLFAEEWTYYKLGDTVIAGRTKCSAGMFDSLSLDPSDKNILVLHGELRDRSSSDGIGIRDAADRGIDYMALGHYHSYRSQKIFGRGTAVYCGTPEGRGFDECGECGFVLIDTDSIGEHRFIPFAKRRVLLVPIDVSGFESLSELKEAIESAVGASKRDDILRIELVGQRRLELWIDEQALEERFKNRFYHFEIKNSTRLMIRKEDHLYDKSLRGEFIRLVSERDDLDELTKEKVIEMGLYALMGEEV